MTAQTSGPGAAPDVFLREKKVLEQYAPVHRVTWWRWIKAGIAPPAVSLGPRVMAWRQSDLERWQRGEWTKDDPPNPA
ncbi:MAG: helix-turn-helix transcriptional regulator [Acidovorax sp.]|uniref:helix-turn-helix transcriptional regulator n=1 Tax=Acidovorax sp. TaxID=1872122 RepID=UPI00391AE607